ncbi:MAG: ribonuclease HII, partial [Asticcacaulis sp.]
MADLAYELAIKLGTGGRVCGVDEAGRGPCAGPVCVAAVILDPANIPEGIDDSKALNEARRFALEPQIKAAAIAWSVITMSVEDIDGLNILGATLEGMKRAVEALDPCA